MAATAVVGPPPGLEAMKQGDGGEEATARHAKQQDGQVKMAAPKEKRYETRFMLALSSSPLVAPPHDMPALNQWYGDWEPFHVRATQSHGLPHSPMGSIGSGARAERQAKGGDHARERERGGEDGDGMGGYSGVMRDGGLTNSRRETGGRYRNRYDERDGDAGQMRMGEAPSRRYATSGKNPFGQISASGTFKPAGKESAEGAQDKRFNMGRMGRERDPPPHTGSDRARNGRDFGALRERRRMGGFDEGEEEEEWESVPKSPDNERRNRAGHMADSAMDWRRSSASKQGGKGPVYNKERESGRKTSFPAWMAEDSEPSWMSEGQNDGHFQLGGGKGAGNEAGSGSGPSRRGAMGEEEINVDDVDVSGMDGIQAFKAQMREKERRERERNQVSSSASTPLTAGPPPGLERRMEYDDQETSRDGSAALQSAGLQQEKSAAALFDNFASSAKQRQQEKQQQQQQQQQQQHDQQRQITPKERAEMEAEQAAVLPGRSSRFARFFDGKPQAAALAAQQKQLEASHRSAAEQSPLSTVASPSATRESAQTGANVNLADLFMGSSSEGAGPPPGKPSDAKEAAAPPPATSPPGLQRNPSEADVQGMQKIMAALMSGGGGGGSEGQKGQEEPHAARPDAPYRSASGGPPGPAPQPPPGIGFNAANQAGRGSPAPHQSSGRSQSPAAGFHHPHQAQGSWGSPVASPNQVYDQRLPPFAGSTQQHPQHGAPFRPPFGIDPRLLSRPLPQGLPPHIAAALNGMPPMGRGIPANFGMPPFPPGVRPPPPPLPPQLQQHMMSLPPQAQHQLLMQHFQHHGAANHFGAPPQMQQQQQQHHHHASPGQQHGGGAGTSPMPPFLSSPHSSSNAAQSAQLMALLGQGPSGGGGGGGGSGNQ